MMRFPYFRSIVHGLVTAALLVPLAFFLVVLEAGTWRESHYTKPFLAVVVLFLLLDAFVETARGLWRGVICGLLFAAPIIVMCFALSWCFFWHDTQAYIRSELRFVAAVSGGLSITLIPLVLKIRQARVKP